MKKTLEKNSGITLIALVVTIIVLLILASISITVILGDNGLIAQAQAAEKATEKGAKQDEEKIKDLNDKINTMVNGGAEGGGPTTPDEPTLKVKLTVDEAKVTGTTIPVTAKVTTIDDETTLTEGITYEFYKNGTVDGASSNNATHEFNSLSETEEYELKVVVTGANGEKVEDSLTVGILRIGCTNEAVYLRYTLGMTWGAFLNSGYNKKIANDKILKEVTVEYTSPLSYTSPFTFRGIGWDDRSDRCLSVKSKDGYRPAFATIDLPCGMVAEDIVGGLWTMNPKFPDELGLGYGGLSISTQ